MAEFERYYRAAWVQGHLDLVLRHFSADASAADWRVEPVIVTSRRVVNSLVLSAPIPVVDRANLPLWAS